MMNNKFRFFNFHLSYSIFAHLIDCINIAVKSYQGNSFQSDVFDTSNFIELPTCSFIYCSKIQFFNKLKKIYHKMINQQLIAMEYCGMNIQKYAVLRNNFNTNQHEIVSYKNIFQEISGQISFLYSVSYKTNIFDLIKKQQPYRIQNSLLAEISYQVIDSELYLLSSPKEGSSHPSSFPNIRLQLLPFYSIL